MSNIIIQNNIAFIPAALERPIFYYIAATPTCILHSDNTPAVQLQVFRNSSDPGDVYYAMLSLQTQLTSSQAAAQAAARSCPAIPADAVLQPLQAIACSATLNIPAMLPEQVNRASLSNEQVCYLFGRIEKKEDIEVLVTLLRSPQSAPVAVSYKVDYLQQLPPSTFELEANWQEVYDYLKTSVGFNILILSVDIEDISSTLISQRTVKIKTRQSDPDSHIIQAGEELTTILISEFFTPVFAHQAPETPPRFGFYLQQVSLKEMDNRRLSAKLSETTAVKRSIYPQALFGALVENSDYQPQRVIEMIDLKDDFFAHRTVNVHLLNPELDDNILLVVANMTYGKQNQALKFNAGAPQPQTFSRPSILDPNTGEMVWPVSYQFTVYFQQPIGGLASVSSGPMSTSLGDVFLDVESLYARYDFTIKTQSHFNWDWYDSVLVTVICQHLRQKNNRIAKSFLLDQHTTHVNYPQMLPDADLWQFDVTKQYSNAANAPHIPVTLNQAIGQDVFIFSTLYPQRTLQVAAGFDWQVVRQATVFLSYNSGPDGPVLQQMQMFTEDGENPQSFSADQLNADCRTIALEILVEFQPDHSNGNDPRINTTTDADFIDIAKLI